MATGHAINRATVLLLKQSINPETGKGFTYSEIGKLLNMSGQAAHFYSGSVTGTCPTCLRKLHKLKTKKTK